MRAVYKNGYIDTNEIFHITDIDDAGAIAYYGYTAEDGSWYIMANNVAAKTYRYVKGNENYTTAWTGRAALSYDYYFNVRWATGMV